MQSFASSLAILSMYTQFAGTIISFLRRSKDRRAGVPRSMIISIVWKSRRVVRPKQRVVGTEKRKETLAATWYMYVRTYVTKYEYIAVRERGKEREAEESEKAKKEGERAKRGDGPGICEIATPCEIRVLGSESRRKRLLPFREHSPKTSKPVCRRI